MMSPNPVLTYRFGCNGDQQPFVVKSDGNNTSDVSLEGSLQGLNQASCLYYSNGVRSNTQLESNATIANLRDAAFLQQNATGIVLEVWMTTPSTLSPDIEGAESAPILVIGHNKEDTTMDGEDLDTRCPGVELFLGLRGNALEVRYSDDDEAESCRVLVVRQQPLERNHLTQVVVVLGNDSATSIYLDGIPVIQGARNDVLTNMSTWDPNATFKFLSSNFDGSLHQVSLYNHSLTTVQVAEMYERGLQDDTADDGLPMNRRAPLRLVAHSEENPAMVVQGESNSFRLGSWNASKPLDYTVMLEILSLPQFGTLLSDTGPISTLGHKIPLTANSRAVPLFYRAWSDDYFNVPRLTHSGRELDLDPEYFSYRAIAVADDPESTLLGWSEPIRQELAVVHVNHPPTLDVPEEAHVPTVQASGLGALPTALLEEVELRDPLDWNIDLVRVDVWADLGTLTIHEDVLPLADFESCRQRQSNDWQCQGTGVANRNMTFLAEPDSVSLLLSNLEYTGFNWEQEDSITVRIYDGSNGPCLSDREHQEKNRFSATENFFAEKSSDVFFTVHEECFGIETSIVIPAIPRATEDSESGRGFFTRVFELDSFSIADIVFWGILVSVICVVCFLLNKCRQRQTRGAQIVTDFNHGSTPRSGSNNV